MLTEKETRVIDAAQGLFHRHGVRRVTMGDIAELAQMSRPALYLVFPSKEAIFEAVVRVRGADTLDRIRQGVAERSALKDKLALAFEVWTVGPYEIVQKSPEASDLIERRHGLAQAAMLALYAEFEQVIAQILAMFVWRKGVPGDLLQLARLLTSAAYGFKNNARNVDELRALLACQIALLDAFSEGDRRDHAGTAASAH